MKLIQPQQLLHLFFTQKKIENIFRFFFEQKHFIFPNTSLQSSLSLIMSAFMSLIEFVIKKRQFPNKTVDNLIIVGFAFYTVRILVSAYCVIHQYSAYFKYDINLMMITTLNTLDIYMYSSLALALINPILAHNLLFRYCSAYLWHTPINQLVIVNWKQFMHSHWHQFGINSIPFDLRHFRSDLIKFVKANIRMAIDYLLIIKYLALNNVQMVGGKQWNLSHFPYFPTSVRKKTLIYVSFFSLTLLFVINLSGKGF